MLRTLLLITLLLILVTNCSANWDPNIPFNENENAQTAVVNSDGEMALWVWIVLCVALLAMACLINRQLPKLRKKKWPRKQRQVHSS